MKHGYGTSEISGGLKFNARLLQCSLKNGNKYNDLLRNILKVQIGVNNAHREQGSSKQIAYVERNSGCILW